MTNWLERARREFSQKASRGTANTAKRTLTAVTAVRSPALSKVSSKPREQSADPAQSNPVATPSVSPLSTAEETAIRGWLDHIEETDAESIEEVLDKCRADISARAFFLQQAAHVQNLGTPEDDRKYCRRCRNLTPRGLCLAARRGELLSTGRDYEPVDTIPRRCEGYLPNASDIDQRPGRKRWPELMPTKTARRDEDSIYL